MYQKLITVLLLSLASTFCLAQTNTPVDYSNEDNWAALPTDSVHIWNNLTDGQPLQSVDVFYVYPTLLTSKKDTRWNYDIDDPQHRKSALTTAVKFQASAFANAGNIYAPYYRQAHIRSYGELESGGRKALLFAYEDVKNAFQYYLNNYNNGNAIILAGHSQGTTQLAQILREFFDNQPLQQQLVAAYLPGIGLDENMYESIPLMTSPNETGGFVTWNTLKKKYDKKTYRKWYKGKAIINPVTWDTTAIAPKSLQKGFLYSNEKMYQQSFETHLVDGAIWITAPKFPFRIMTITMKNYHAGDINLFWEDIRFNSRLRAEKFLKRKNSTLSESDEK